jgi:hypothetical protein
MNLIIPDALHRYRLTRNVLILIDDIIRGLGAPNQAIEVVRGDGPLPFALCQPVPSKSGPSTDPPKRG